MELGIGPDRFVEQSAHLDAAWEKSGRDDKPHKAALGYFSLGDDAQKNADEYLRD